MNYSTKATPQFWKNKKVLITGHTGFKGSWLSLWLSQLGSQLYGYSLLPQYSPNIFELFDESIIKTKIADILDRKQLNSFIYDIKPEIVFHLAAQPLVIESYKNPVLTWETNVNGTINLLEACRKTNAVRAIIVCTTDKIYKNDDEETKRFTEDHPLGGKDPYSSSKAAVELLSFSWFHSFFKDENIGLATARAGNVIGGGDFSQNRIIPDLIKSALNQDKNDFILRNPKSIRPWQFVLEPLLGYINLAECLCANPQEFSTSFNFSPNSENEITTQKLVQKFSEKLPSLIIKSSGSHATSFHETRFLKLDNSKALEKLRWKPKLDLEDTINFTVSTYKELMRPISICEKLDILSSIIKRYESLS